MESLHARYTPAERLVRVPEEQDLGRRLARALATLREPESPHLSVDAAARALSSRAPSPGWS